MGKLFSHHGFMGPGEIKAKRNYELKKCFRYAAREKIAFTPPERFPFNPLAIIRLATLSANHSPSKQVETIDFIFNQVWGKGQVLEDPEKLDLLFSEHGLDVQIIEKSFAREAKDELKENIRHALKIGLFGVPSFYFPNENTPESSGDFFWGNDSFEDIRQFLEGNDIWNKELYNKVLSHNEIP